ncbi:MAG: hypothetical protein IT451_00600 [Candidatus Brocadia sp.]|nr:hypothetical protein [Candidatus Brocadia sp.]
MRDLALIRRKVVAGHNIPPTLSQRGLTGGFHLTEIDDITPKDCGDAAL